MSGYQAETSDEESSEASEVQQEVINIITEIKQQERKFSIVKHQEGNLIQEFKTKVDENALRRSSTVVFTEIIQQDEEKPDQFVSEKTDEMVHADEENKFSHANPSAGIETQKELEKVVTRGDEKENISKEGADDGRANGGVEDQEPSENHGDLLIQLEDYNYVPNAVENNSENIRPDRETSDNEKADKKLDGGVVKEKQLEDSGTPTALLIQLDDDKPVGDIMRASLENPTENIPLEVTLETTLIETPNVEIIPNDTTNREIPSDNGVREQCQGDVTGMNEQGVTVSDPFNGKSDHAMTTTCLQGPKSGAETVHVSVKEPVSYTPNPFTSFTSFTVYIDTSHHAFSVPRSAVRRRFSEFRWLRRLLWRHHPHRRPPELPPGGMLVWNKTDDSFLEARRAGLQTFLREVICVPMYLGEKALHFFLQTELPIRDIEANLEGLRDDSVKALCRFWPEPDKGQEEVTSSIDVPSSRGADVAPVSPGSVTSEASSYLEDTPDHWSPPTGRSGWVPPMTQQNSATGGLSSSLIC